MAIMVEEQRRLQQWWKIIFLDEEGQVGNTFSCLSLLQCVSEVWGLGGRSGIHSTTTLMQYVYINGIA